MTRSCLSGLLVAVAAVAMVGCSAFHASHTGPLLPILPHPPAPRLAHVSAAELGSVSPETAARLLSRDAAIKHRLRRYHDVVETYNAWAHQQNQRNGYERSEEP